MFYCPKCQKTYEDAVQRFCLDDGRRLIRVLPDDQSSEQTNDVFKSILNRKNKIETEKFVDAPRFSRARIERSADSSFLPSFDAEIFEVNPSSKPQPSSIESAFEAVPFSESIAETNDEINAEIENQSNVERKIEIQAKPEIEIESAPDIESKFASDYEFAPEFDIYPETETEPEIEVEEELKFEDKSALMESEPRFIAPWEIPQSEAKLGDRKINSADREPFTRENPSALIDQTIKGRYLIVEQTGADESGILYLAEDKIVSHKKVVVRVLMDEGANDSFANKIYAEERISLSHFNHPNVAGVIDSGEMPEGKPFIVSEFVEGKSVGELLQDKETFDPQRTAGIVRQAANALSEVHQSGVLHRNLKPENIILTINEKGAEQVKLTNFGAAKEKVSDANLPYKSPEQIENKLANVTSDEYALAVIAYQMLTGKLPFKPAPSTGKLLKARREKLKNEANALPASAHTILGKALAFNIAERYPKARDFGEAFYGAIFAGSDLKDEKIIEVEAIETPVLESEIISGAENNFKPEIENLSATKTVEGKAVAKTSGEAKSNRAFLAVFGVAALLLGIWIFWSFLPNRAVETKPIVQNASPNANVAIQTTTNVAPLNTNNLPSNETTETAPLPRSITQPPNTNYFQNGKENLKGEALKNYLGFSLYYPKDWKVNPAGGGNSETRGTFLDVSKNAASGTPVEQMIVSYYDSSGTFKTDSENFKKEVGETNETLSKIIPNYKMISEGERTINNDRKTYEIKFEGTGKTPAGEKITLWGKRLFVPAATRGVKNGYMITLLATSLSKDVKSVGDVGVKGNLPKILYTFEPNQTF